MTRRNQLHPHEIDHLALIIGRAVICITIGAAWMVALWYAA